MANQIQGKDDILRIINESSAQANLKIFLGHLHDICFEKCITTPGPSMSRNDEACVSNCVRKYMNVHDTVSKEWNTSIQKLQQERGGL